MTTATRAHHLPPETIGNVMSFLPQADLKNLRLVDHRFSTLATRWLFRRTRLLARTKDNNDPQRFIQLANSEFSEFVREVSCDVSSIVHNGFYYMEKDQSEFLPVFWDALPLLGHFRNMQTLHLCFDANSTPQVHEAGSTKFRKRVMKTVFRILTGTLTTEVSNTTQDALSSTSTEISPSSTPSSPITLSTLIISNLGDYHDPELSNMPEFKAALGNITALRLDIAHHKGGGSRYRTAVPNQCREMLTQLPSTWLSSTVTANLQTLSLHYQSYWSWFPNIDIRLFGGGNGMPKLKSLALGHFVFSHQRDVDFITSLNLEELFLEGCVVLANRRSDLITQEGSWTDVNESTVTIATGGETEMTSLWWHQIIWQIHNSMLNLKRFSVSRLPGMDLVYRRFLRMIHSNPSFRGYEIFRDEHIREYMDSWSKFEAFKKHVCRPWNEAFQHYTYITSIELSLE
ncbi:hypothetical protein FANTH_2567 [Fusarium anthophilum]|uniref:F-box domain-containing protein n=1 Tax=Fusarium anthophilum TaxID=48485 RepID=A0A8H4ZTF8_9HYPO|nr:hypothetical protein FANTH_2567 [Fusarium anthophilum]